MNVVGHPADFDSLHFVLPGNATEEGPKPFGKWRRNERTALFSAEHTMEIGADVGHARIQPSLRDLDVPRRRDPTLKRLCEKVLSASGSEAGWSGRAIDKYLPSKRRRCFTFHRDDQLGDGRANRRDLRRQLRVFRW